MNTFQQDLELLRRKATLMGKVEGKIEVYIHMDKWIVLADLEKEMFNTFSREKHGDILFDVKKYAINELMTRGERARRTVIRNMMETIDLVKIAEFPATVTSSQERFIRKNREAKLSTI